MNYSFFLLLLITLSSAAQTPETAPLDSLTETSRRYYNRQQPDSLYALMGDAFHGQISAAQFSQISQGLKAQLGTWQSAERRSVKDGVARYKATFDKGLIDFYISRDKAGKIHTFLFKPYEADVADKTSAVPTSNLLKTNFDQQVDAVARAYIKKANTVGLSIGILRNDSLFTYNYGETAKGNGQLPDANTLFEIGSISKTFTATLLADAVQRGLVKLDDPVNKYLPDSIPKLQKDGIPVTLKTLANHTSGLPRLPTNLFSTATDMNNPYKHYDQKLLYTYLKTATLSRQPGKEYEYSNLAVGLLGTVLETVNKKTYEELVKERIAKPLGMAHTVLTLNEPDKKRFAQGNDAKGNPASSWEFQALAGAGALRSSVNDLVPYLKAELGKGPKKLVEAMKATQQTTFTNGNTAVGLGWHRRSEDARPWFWHQGGTGGFVTYVAFNPSRQIAVILLTNSQSPIDELVAGAHKLAETNTK
ncbi:CubicO group peptidase (beta-lactamase class C family) [Larkinella arboricola]|uniref:Beta-lactamase n=1 Tax=Larkinella arboricola TaxID=643671 RepID=A0A327X8V7_LARAB|nr:serine hydrolase domain-containing protein [Larkinella arboricola]RAK02102.1 CubicO group peptidase (beta-lactamase class C family) [Larkinella arboricola]